MHRKQLFDVGGSKIVYDIFISTKNLISFLSNSQYLSTPIRLNILLLFKLVDVSKPKLFPSPSLFVTNA